LRSLLSHGGVVIYNVGPDKYQGRVVADVATRRTDNVSAALLAAGHVRSYNGGHRFGWCARSWR
jgi:micrococcal nuclease